jgi:tryptophanyl-tRNA synthetase
VRRTDPGNPDHCPVWQLHQVYSSDEVRAWADRGCRSAGIGCLDCKQPVIDAIVAEQKVFIDRAAPFVEDPRRVRDIMDAGCERARAVARETMKDVRDAMGLGYA